MSYSDSFVVCYFFKVQQSVLRCTVSVAYHAAKIFGVWKSFNFSRHSAECNIYQWMSRSTLQNTDVAIESLLFQNTSSSTDWNPFVPIDSNNLSEFDVCISCTATCNSFSEVGSLSESNRSSQVNMCCQLPWEIYFFETFIEFFKKYSCFLPFVEDASNILKHDFRRRSSRTSCTPFLHKCLLLNNNGSFVLLF